MSLLHPRRYDDAGPSVETPPCDICNGDVEGNPGEPGACNCPECPNCESHGDKRCVINGGDGCTAFVRVSDGRQLKPGDAP